MGVSSHRLRFLVAAAAPIVEGGATPTTGVASHLCLRAGGAVPVSVSAVVVVVVVVGGTATGVWSHLLTPAVVGAPDALALMTGVASQRARLVRTGASMAVVLSLGGGRVAEEEDEDDDEEEDSFEASAAILS